MNEARALVSEAERARAVLRAGVSLFRWAAFAWMTVLALTGERPFRNPWLAGAALAVAATWTVWITVRERSRTTVELAIELAIACALVVISGLVVQRGEIVGSHPFFATAWPVVAAMAWGVARGPNAGVIAGLMLSIALIVSRIVNSLALSSLTAPQWQSLASGAITYVLAGGAVGLVSRLLERSSRESTDLAEAAARVREQAARLAERDVLARQIHDSVLQSLAMVHKRGRELAQVHGSDVGALATMAAEQEEALRALILRDPSEHPSGTASLRDMLEATARAQPVAISVSTTGPIWIAAHPAEELEAAVRQALANVREHAGANHVTLFAELDDGWVTVSVRDDGRGFVYDEEQLRAAGKAGMLKSMKGRVEALGGTMSVRSAPLGGTEIELRIPAGGKR